MNDDRLRTALLDLGDVPTPPDLAGAALARSRRDRRRAVAGLVALVAVLAAAAVSIPSVVLHRAPAAQTAGPALGRFVVAGYASRDPHVPTAGRGRYELYRGSGAGYRVVPGRGAVPSPDGRMVALISDQRKVGLVPADWIDDPQVVLWIPVSNPVSDAVWSPDSRRLLVPKYTQDRYGATTSTALVVDAGTVGVRDLQLSWTTLEGQPVGRLVFGPRGDGVAAIDSGGWAPALLQIWADTGQRSSLSVPRLTVPDQPFSPSGRLLAGYEDGRTTVVDLSSGAKSGSVEGEVSGWYDEDRLVVLSGRSVRVVDYRSGRVLVQREIATDGRLLTGVWLAPVRGAVPPGAIVL
jgi:hypothetical protein